MIPRGALLVLLNIFVVCQTQLIFPRQVSKKPRMNANRIVDVHTACSKDSMDVRVTMEKPFKGVVFAKDFSRECRSQGNLDTLVTLRLPGNACGVRVGSQQQQSSNPIAPNNPSNSSTDVEDLFEEDLYYLVTVVVQMDKFLQQSSDEERVVKCWLKPRAMRIQSSAIEEMIEKNIKDMASNKGDFANHRSGRMGSEWKDISAEEQASIMEQARAWMEIVPSSGNLEATAVEVGEPTMIVVKSTLPAGVGFRITDCLAHDGLGESSQRLLDELGCPVDELIFPPMRVHPLRIAKTDAAAEAEDSLKGIMSYKRASATFAAFKFPDRARLHLSCGVELCRGECARHDCKRGAVAPTLVTKSRKQADSPSLMRRRVRLDGEEGEDSGPIIDRLQVYNSIEVLAPNIELENDASIRGSRQSFGSDSFSMSADKTVCMSPSKMALAFCILGLIFLTALVVAFISLIRARRKYGSDRFGGPLSFYTGSKSIFSQGSGSSNSGFSGSKLLLTDSPYLEHQSTSSNWPYGRVI